jgi:putative ABC transport system substrate-binding protein
MQFDQLKRREFMKLLGGAAVTWPLPARAEQASDRPLIGVLLPISSVTAMRNIEAFREGLRDLGYVEGRNITMETRFAEGTIERLPALAAELVALKPAIIVAGSPPAVLAARNVTHTIPIVMNSNENPITLGLAASLARPGGNVTGFWWGDEGLIGKQLELLKGAVPSVERVGIMVHPGDASTSEPSKSLPTVTPALGITARVIEVHSPTDFEPAFATAKREGLQGLQMGNAILFVSNRAQLTALAASARLPTIYGIREFTTAGGLMSYGTSLPDLYRNKARLVDKILKGASPADLPIERPTKFELVINLQTARTLGIEVPNSIQLLADEIIE